MSNRPHYEIVCDHGIRGGQLDRVTLLGWSPIYQAWVFVNGLDDDVELFEMDGNRRIDWDPFRAMTHMDGKPSEEPTRRAFDIRCSTPRCSRRSYRSDTDRLQILLDLIASDTQIRDAVTVSATDALIAIKLDVLHAVRDTARASFHLNV